MCIRTHCLSSVLLDMYATMYVCMYVFMYVCRHEEVLHLLEQVMPWGDEDDDDDCTELRYVCMYVCAGLLTHYLLT